MEWLPYTRSVIMNFWSMDGNLYLGLNNPFCVEQMYTRCRRCMGEWHIYLSHNSTSEWTHVYSKATLKLFHYLFLISCHIYIAWRGYLRLDELLFLLCRLCSHLKLKAPCILFAIYCRLVALEMLLLAYLVLSKIWTIMLTLFSQSTIAWTLAM